MKELKYSAMKKIFYYLMLAFTISACSSDDEVAPKQEELVDEIPVAVDDSYNAIENQNLIISGLLDNDTVVDNARIRSIDEETVEGGEISDNRDGTYTYTPPSNFTGQDSFTYTLCVPLSDERCSTANVAIIVGDAGSPVAADDTYETQENNALRISSYLNNDELVDNATVSSVDYEGSNATVVLGEDESISYTPSEGFSGVDSFTYTICDDDETPSCSTATITVNVIDEGSPVANDDLVVIGVGSGLVSIDNVLENDELIDGAALASIDASASQGNVVLKEDGTISYTPQNGFTGEDTFTYSLCDDDMPEATCATATVTVLVIEPVGFNIPSGLEDYYGNIVFSNNPEVNLYVLSGLTVAQHSIILSYGQRHDYLYDADEDLDNPENVILMYTGESRYWREYSSDNNSYSPQTFNTEHIYPQSRLTADDAVTDLHHLRVADADINSLRLNHPYADGEGEAKLIGDDAWYPGDEWKGDVARMIFYLNIRYGETFDKVGNLDLFLEWNREDPVSEFELQRQRVIAGAQGNRNPFIDNPYLATLIWGGEPAENRWD